MESVVKYECRGCGMTGKKPDMYSLAEDDNRSLFENCTSITLLLDDPADPKHLCFHCFHQCQMWLSFVNLCQQRNTEYTIKSEEDLEFAVKEEKNEDSGSVLTDSGHYDEGDDLERSSCDLEDCVWDDEMMDDDSRTDNNVISEFEDFLEVDSMPKDVHWQRCPLCHAHFPDYIYLREHLKERHLQDKVPQCPICKLNLGRMCKVYSHIVTQHIKNAGQALPQPPTSTEKATTGNSSGESNSDETCVICGVKCSSQEMYQHLKTEHFHSKWDRNITCHVCNEKFETFLTYDKHFSEKHFQNEELLGDSESESEMEQDPAVDDNLDGTDSSHTSQSQVEEQPRKKIKIKVKKCPTCGKWVRNLYMHKRRHNSSLVMCQVCKANIREMDMGRHKKCIVTCKFCPQQFCGKRPLNKHIKLMHSATAFRVFEKFSYK